MTLGDPDMRWALRGPPPEDTDNFTSVTLGGKVLHGAKVADGLIPPPESQRQAFLQEVTRIVTRNRNADYGEPEDSFRLIADYWSLYLGKKYGVTLAATDVPLLMALLKLARLTTNPAHHDSQVDVAGYMACLAEIREGKA